jgi:putative addiction module killer protein
MWIVAGSTLRPPMAQALDNAACRLSRFRTVIAYQAPPGAVRMPRGHDFGDAGEGVDIEFPLVTPVYYDIRPVMITVRRTATFDSWLHFLKDGRARARIGTRLRRLELGNPGDVKPVGSGVSELRIDYGPGYRVYLVNRGKVLIVLLCGGDKRTQDRDVKQAIEMATELED